MKQRLQLAPSPLSLTPEIILSMQVMDIFINQNASKLFLDFLLWFLLKSGARGFFVLARVCSYCAGVNIYYIRNKPAIRYNGDGNIGRSVFSCALALPIAEGRSSAV